MATIEKRKDRSALIFKEYLTKISELKSSENQSSEIDEISPVYTLNDEDVYSAFNGLDWSFSDDDTTYLSHDIHPYPAKFPPQLPAQVIRLLSSAGETIWDPFGGSGTTALEALLCERQCISTDINPVGSLIGKAKTTSLCSEDEQELDRLLINLDYYVGNASCMGDFVVEHDEEIKKEIPAIPNIDKWFSSTAICELAFLKYMIKNTLKRDASRTIAMASFSKIITRVSNQESETTYRAVEKELHAGDTLSIYLKDLRLNYEKIKKISSLIGYKTCSFVTTNVMEPIVGNGHQINSGAIDLIVTSPPYPNAFDYHLYHRFRIFWLDEDPKKVGKVEIGSHLKYQRNNDDFEQFENEMKPVLKNCFEALKQGRYAVFVLGNAIFNGIEYKTAERIGELATQSGFVNIGIIERSLPENKRSVKSWARRATSEQILILKKPNTSENISLLPVKYRLWPYEREISSLERNVLCGSDIDLFLAPSNFETNKLKKLTFYRAFQVNGFEMETWQNILEHGGQDDASSRKDPKYLTHGIHPYKGKFYPQLVRPLLNILQIPKRGIVFDPFCGSGTVALESILNGYNAFGCDVNPIAIEIATAKNTIFKVNPYEFEKQIYIFKKELSKYNISGDYKYIFAEDTIEEIESWFPERVISKMGFILTQIAVVPDERIRCFLRVILSSIIREISQQDPSDLRIRRRKVNIEDAPVIELFTANLDKQVSNIMAYYRTSNNAPEPIGEADIWRGNSTCMQEVKEHLLEESVDVVITSPPYATALPYIDTNRLSILVLNGINASNRVPIEAEMTGTREIKKSTRAFYETKIRGNDFSCIISETARNIITKVYTQNEGADVGFRKKNMAALLYMYFEDMTKAMNMMNIVVKSDGYICIVIGDTKTTTGEEEVIIKTTRFIRETGVELGWSLVYDIPISVTVEKYKHMHNSITENNILIFKKG